MIHNYSFTFILFILNKINYFIKYRNAGYLISKQYAKNYFVIRNQTILWCKYIYSNDFIIHSSNDFYLFILFVIILNSL